MGAFLDTPNTAKETEDYTDKKNGLIAGVSCMQGWRIDMEVRGLPPGPIHHPSSIMAKKGPCALTAVPAPIISHCLPLQDAHSVKLGVEGHDDWSWFAVYDGHGGSLVAQKR